MRCPTTRFRTSSSRTNPCGDGDVVMMQLRPKPGAQFDESEVRGCIQHTIEKTRS
jgi:hypothetical protein